MICSPFDRHLSAKRFSHCRFCVAVFGCEIFFGVCTFLDRERASLRFAFSVFAQLFLPCDAFSDAILNDSFSLLLFRAGQNDCPYSRAVFCICDDLCCHIPVSNKEIYAYRGEHASRACTENCK